MLYVIPIITTNKTSIKYTQKEIENKKRHFQKKKKSTKTKEDINRGN